MFVKSVYFSSSSPLVPESALPLYPDLPFDFESIFWRGLWRNSLMDVPLLEPFRGTHCSREETHSLEAVPGSL